MDGSVASVGPLAWRSDLLSKLGGYVDLEPPVPPLTGRRSLDLGFPPEVITVAVRRYLRYGLSYCDVEEMLPELRSQPGPLRPVRGTGFHH